MSYLLIETNSTKLIQCNSLLMYNNLFHAFFTRESLDRYQCGADSNGNCEKLFRAMDISPDNIVSPIQIHSSNVKSVSKAGYVHDTDSVITNRYNLFLTVKTADCAPVILYDPVKQSLGLIHAGWRGIISGIVEKTVESLELEYGSRPLDLLAVIGPCIKECCYEVKDDVAERFSNYELIQRDGRIFLDMIKGIENRLTSCGILRKNVESIGLCTSCHNDLFFSYRREGRINGSNLSIVGLKGER